MIIILMQIEFLMFIQVEIEGATKDSAPYTLISNFYSRNEVGASL